MKIAFPHFTLFSIPKVELFGTRAHCTDFIGAGMIVLTVLGIALEDVVVKRLRKKLPYI